VVDNNDELVGIKSIGDIAPESGVAPALNRRIRAA
jgi:hypothetical protein